MARRSSPRASTIAGRAIATGARASSLLAGCLIAGCSIAGCGGGQTRVLQERGTPEIYEARVAAARGPIVPQQGDDCRIAIVGTNDAIYNCRIVIECSGDVVYGLANGGYNACHAQGEHFVFARDRNGTRQDGDPRMHFDLIGGRVWVSDDAPDVELELDLSDEIPAPYQQQRPPDLEPGARVATPLDPDAPS